MRRPTCKLYPAGDNNLLLRCRAVYDRLARTAAITRAKGQWFSEVVNASPDIDGHSLTALFLCEHANRNVLSSLFQLAH